MQFLSENKNINIYALFNVTLFSDEVIKNIHFTSDLNQIESSD